MHTDKDEQIRLNTVKNSLARIFPFWIYPCASVAKTLHFFTSLPSRRFVQVRIATTKSCALVRAKHLPILTFPGVETPG